VNLDRPIVAAAAQIAPVFMKKKDSLPAEKIEAIARDLEGLAVEVDA
jgi:hypothetical protein